jgi:glucose uptake protein
MVLVTTYSVAVFMCIITMLCWGSWANTQKLASRQWPFQLYYWDYCIGVLVLTLLFALTLGSLGSFERSFADDLSQASLSALGLALLGGIIFNLANLLLVAAIDIAGMAVAFPIGIGIALVEGVIVNHIRAPKGDPAFLFTGVACVAIAIIINSIAYSRLPAKGDKTLGKGIVLSVVCGLLMGLFFYLVAAAIPPAPLVDNITAPEFSGRITPYTALVVFSIGLFLSNFVFNSFLMAKPFVGDPVPVGDYFQKGDFKLHLIGILGGMIWGVGMSFAMISGDAAGYAISYGLGQGATMVAAFWGVFVWKEFKEAPAGTDVLLALMFLLFIVGLALIVYANV